MFKHFIFKTILPVLDYQCELFVLFGAISFFEIVLCLSFVYPLYLDSFLASIGNESFPLYRIHIDNIRLHFGWQGSRGNQCSVATESS